MNAAMAFLEALAAHVEAPSQGTWAALESAAGEAGSEGLAMRIGNASWIPTLGERVTELLERDTVAWASLLHHLLTHDDASFWHGPGLRLKKASPFRDADLLASTLAAPASFRGETAPVLQRAAAGADRLPTGTGGLLVPVPRPKVRTLSSGESPRPGAGDPSPAAARAAAATLAHLGYTYAEGAALWRPPLGSPPDFGEIDRRRALALALESGAVDKLSPEGVALVVAALREGRPKVAPQD